jgi:cell division protein FtsI (penicillin-binding protein 3)
MAMDIPIESLAIDPTLIMNYMSAASTFAKILSGDEKTYLELLEKNRNRSFVRLIKEISEDQKSALFSSDLPGLIVIKGRKRVRPYPDLALQVLGITNGIHKGVGGIEQAFDHILRGEDGWAIYQKDGLNRNFISPDYPVEISKNGHHLILAIDHALQAVMEEELKKGVRFHQAKGGSAVLMDPFTGDILGMVSVLGDRAEDTHDFSKVIQNRAVQIDFEPGSTFKIVPMAAALEEGLYQSNTLIHCENGEFRIGDETINDHNERYSWLTLSQVMEKSSNIGIAKVGKKLGKKLLYKYAQNFGFGNRTGIGLPSETSGILRPIYQWAEFNTAAFSFGQGVSVTTLQLACMMSVIANGGELVKPRIIRAILDNNNAEIRTFPSQVIRNVISEETVISLKAILERVVSQGSGKEARVDGIRVAGKTGTAQKSVPGFKGYLPGAYVASFVGFWPAETPMFVLVVVLDEPIHQYWGSTSAAPIFSRMVSRIVGLPVSPNRPEFQREQDFDDRQIVFSNLETGSNDKNESKNEKPSAKPSPYHFPNLIGLSVRAALQQMAIYKIEVKVHGNGIVISQEPKPGEKIEKGSICRLICSRTLKGDSQ